MLNRLLDPLDWNRLRPWAWVVVALVFAVAQLEKLLDDEDSWIPYADWGMVALGLVLLGSALRDARRHERSWRQRAAPVDGTD